MDLVESYADDLRFARRPFTRTLLGLLLLAVAAFPWVAPDYMIFIATLVALYSIGVMGQNLLIGYTGQISFGQAGFLAIGAFAFGHLRIWGAPFLVALAGAGALAALAGVLVGFPSLRLKGPYLSIATLGFGVAVYQVFVNWEVLSGGRSGLSIVKLKPMLGLSATHTTYYIYVLLLAGFTLATYNIISSYIGRAFIAIRDADIAAEVNGINLTRYKLLSFAISSFYTGVHGALYAQVLGHIEPQIFNIGESLTLFVAVIIGGVASIEGSILGALFVILVPKLFANFREMVPVVYGVTILVVLIFEPLGLFGRWLKTRLYFQLWPFR
ncbi:MAG: branched-chain amino acid ABC transporter permease [Candidatus Rokubacteria bacterium]|nr:branched-chain amino acid ABC transporter permease [Candidatus Rokubacteria bacterium]MBI4255697.1 branched-chain amino acid ABC transporter permease [Candidatus Rokubacteria bacterium]